MPHFVSYFIFDAMGHFVFMVYSTNRQKVNMLGVYIMDK